MQPLARRAWHWRGAAPEALSRTPFAPWGAIQMRSPAAPYLAAVDAALRTSSALVAAMVGAARIYTEVPTNAPLPYVVIGRDEIQLEDLGDCGSEAEVTSVIGVWSRTDPPDKGAQARAIGKAIIAALNVELAIAGWDVDLWKVESERYSTDPDQSTKGIIELRYLLTEGQP